MTSSPTLIKHSPIAEIYQRHPVQITRIEGWEIAHHFGNPEQEMQQLKTGSVLADWSHIGKLSVSGTAAAAYVEQLFSGAGAIAPLTTHQTSDAAILRLTANDYLILCHAGAEADLLDRITHPKISVINQTGAMGCFVLAGIRRDDVLERSTAMNLRRDIITPGSVLQTTLHTIRCTFYRTPKWEVIIHPRNLSVSLFEALTDVGMRVGLRPTGVGVLPVLLEW
jgi:glycine cleavage system aminomethyltransferase T